MKLTVTMYSPELTNQVLSLIERAIRSGVHYIYLKAAEALIELGFPEKAYIILKKALTDTEDVNDKLHALADLAIALINLGNIEHALKLIDSAVVDLETRIRKNSVIYFSTINAIVNAVMNVYKPENAAPIVKKLINHIDDTYVRSKILVSSVIIPQVHEGRFDETIEDLISDVKHIFWRVFALIEIAKYFVKNASRKSSALLERALKLIDRIDSAGDRARLLANIASVFASIEKENMADRLLITAVDLAGRESDIVSRSLALAQIANILVRLGKRFEARLLFDEAIDASRRIVLEYEGIRSDYLPEVMNGIKAQIVEMLAKAGEYQRAMELANEIGTTPWDIGDYYWHSIALINIARGIVKTSSLNYPRIGFLSIHIPDDIFSRQKGLMKGSLSAFVDMEMKMTLDLSAWSRYMILEREKIEFSHIRSGSIKEFTLVLKLKPDIETKIILPIIIRLNGTKLITNPTRITL